MTDLPGMGILPFGAFFADRALPLTPGIDGASFSGSPVNDTGMGMVGINKSASDESCIGYSFSGKSIDDEKTVSLLVEWGRF